MRLLRWWKKTLSALVLYLSVVGLVTFTLFILEESIQMATFGSWPAQQAKDWRTALAACDQIRTVNRILKVINYSVGWIQPLAFLSYWAYARSTDIYIAGLEAKIFANAPELFAGRTVTFTFVPCSQEKTPSGFLSRNGRISVFSAEPMPVGVPCLVTGKVMRPEGYDEVCP